VCAPGLPFLAGTPTVIRPSAPYAASLCEALNARFARAGIELANSDSDRDAGRLGGAEARRARPFAVLQMLDALGLEIRFHETPGFNTETLEPRRAKKNSRLVPT
jgi:hypothetical protein